MRRPSVRSFSVSLLAGGLALLLASPGLAYVVVLKGGKRHISTDKPVERNGQLTFIEKGSKVQYTVAVADVDLERTKEANLTGTGDAYVLSPDGKTRALRPQGSSGPSLNDRVQRLKKTPRPVVRKPPSEATDSTPEETKPTSKKKGSRAPTPTPTPAPGQ
jgi:hypothetical protein